MYLDQLGVDYVLSRDFLIYQTRMAMKQTGSDGVPRSDNWWLVIQKGFNGGRKNPCRIIPPNICLVSIGVWYLSVINLRVIDP